MYNQSHRSIVRLSCILSAGLAATAVFAGSPTADSVTPSSGFGFNHILTFSFADSGGFAYLNRVEVLFSATDGENTNCHIRYYRSTNKLQLDNDAGAPLPLVTPRSTEMAANSQCTLYGASSDATGTGNILTLRLDLTFKAGLPAARQSFCMPRMQWD